MWMLVLVVAAAAPSATSARLELVPGPCAAASGVQSKVAARLGYEVFSEAAPREVRVVFTQTELGFRATMTVDDAERELSSRKCDTLVDAVAFSIAVALDPVRAMGLPVSDETREIIGTVDVGPRRRAPSSDPRWELTFGPVFALGSAPIPTVGLTFGTGLRRGLLAAYLEGRADLPVERALASGGRVRTNLVGASFLPCLVFARAGACLSASANALGVEGFELNDPQAGLIPLLTFGARAWLEIPSERGWTPSRPLLWLHLRLGVGLEAGVFRPQLVDTFTGAILLEPGQAQLTLFIQGVIG